MFDDHADDVADVMLLWPPYVIGGHYIFALLVSFFLFLFFFLFFLA